MNQITIDNILLGEVPGVAFGFDVNNYGHESDFMYMIDMEDVDETVKSQESLITKKLPKAGSWQFIGTTDEVTEEMAAQIVKKEKILNAEYYFDYVTGRPFYYYAVMSYKSWKRANKIPSDKRFAILKQVI